MNHNALPVVNRALLLVRRSNVLPHFSLVNRYAVLLLQSSVSAMYGESGAPGKKFGAPRRIQPAVNQFGVETTAEAQWNVVRVNPLDLPVQPSPPPTTNCLSLSLVAS